MAPVTTRRLDDKSTDVAVVDFWAIGKNCDVAAVAWGFDREMAVGQQGEGPIIRSGLFCTIFLPLIRLFDNCGNSSVNDR